MCIFFYSCNLDVSHKSKLSTLQILKKWKQLEGQVQELESRVSSLQQQLKETEENYEAEIHSLQEGFKLLMSPQFSYKVTFKFIQ